MDNENFEKTRLWSLTTKLDFLSHLAITSIPASYIFVFFPNLPIYFSRTLIFHLLLIEKLTTASCSWDIAQLRAIGDYFARCQPHQIGCLIGGQTLDMPSLWIRNLSNPDFQSKLTNLQNCLQLSSWLRLDSAVFLFPPMLAVLSFFDLHFCSISGDHFLLLLPRHKQWNSSCKVFSNLFVNVM